MRRVLLTGAGGQLGAELARASWADDVELVVTDRASLDLTDLALVARVLELRPDVIVNAAAYTAVDAAEDDAATATAVNDVAVARLVEAAAVCDATLVHVSTDYVFDGTLGRPYVEADATAPLGVYGRTKLAGEAHVLAEARHVVVRTSWVFGALGANFVRTMRRVAAGGTDLRVVADQIGCPSATPDLARVITAIVAAGCHTGGLFHAAAPNACSWHELAVAAVATLDPPPGVALTPIATSDWPTPVTRPADSRLDSTKLTSAYGVGVRPWGDGLAEVADELNRRGEP